MLRQALSIGVLTLAALSSIARPAHGQGDGPQPVRALIRDAGAAIVSPLDQPEVMRRRSAQIDTEMLQQLRQGDAFTLNLFDDAALDVVIDEYRQSAAETFHWRGHVPDRLHSHIQFVLHRGAISGSASGPGVGSYRIVNWRDTGLVVEQLNDAKFGRCGCTAQNVINGLPPAPQAPPAQVEGNDGLIGPPSCGTFMDVMAVYTPEARIQAGGHANVQTIIINAIDLTNQTFVNSAIGPRVRLVHMTETPYVESGSFYTELARLEAMSDGFMDEVHALRDQYGADMVALVISHTGGSICGLAELMGSPPSGAFENLAFSVNNTGCITPPNLVLAHELGHNMGCHHDHDNAGGTPSYPYAYGHRFTGTDSILYRTVMAYLPGERTPHYSNPNILYQGVPTGLPEGDPLAADNARAINQNASIVASFREGSVGLPVTWATPGVIFPNDGANGDRFGVAVAVAGDLAIVGSYTDDDKETDSGSAYIYRFDSTLNQWVQESKLTASDWNMNDRFGVSVDILNDDNGEVAIIGAYLNDDGGRDSGSAYIFRNTGTGWQEESKLLAEDDNGGDLFGRSVAITRSGGAEVAIIGAYQDDDGGSATGSAYIFSNGAEGWEQEEKLNPKDAEAQDQFGFCVDIATSPDNTLQAIIGAWRDDEGTIPDVGSAYIFERGQTGWFEADKLTASDGSENDQFGFAVALTLTENERVAVVGSWKEDDSITVNTGAAYAFGNNGSAGWTQEAKLTAPGSLAEDHFGCAVAVHASGAIVGSYLTNGATSDEGAAHVFRRAGSVWTLEDTILPPDPAQDDQYGFSVGIHENTAIIGAWLNSDANEVESGSVYIARGVTFIDCNNNGTPDSCDITNGTSQDANGNGIPDECEKPAPTCPADIAPPGGGDGVVNVNDLLAVIGNWGATGVPGSVPGDVNGDGVVNVNDLLAVVGAWGACP